MYRLARHVELIKRNDEDFLVARSPLCVLKLNRSLAELISRGDHGPITPAGASETAVLEQLAGKGFLERLREPVTMAIHPSVSVVIPVKDRAIELQRCLASIANIDYPRELLQVIVVDDGSSDDSPHVARQAGARVIPSGGTGRGPAAARNVGARAATGAILAFIDSDCTATTGWLADLIPAFADPAVAAVGGQVDGMCSSSAVDRYEAVMSSLSLGSRQRTGSSGDDTFYLPSCNLLVRRHAFLAANGFRDEMHVGEDVDLTWRLRDLGWTISYLPAGRVNHEHRSTIRSFMSRRFDYGTSEGMLQQLHPHRHKKMVVPPLLATVLLLCIVAPFAGWWFLASGAVLLALDTAAVRLRLGRRGIPLGIAAVAAGRLRALGSLVYYLSYHLVRYYSTPLLMLPLADSRLLPLFPAIAVCATAVDYAVRRPQLAFPSFAAIYLLEQVAYGSGVFWGCLRGRTFASYRVEMLGQMENSA